MQIYMALAVAVVGVYSFSVVERLSVKVVQYKNALFSWLRFSFLCQEI